LLAIGHPFVLVIIAIALHGVSFDFFVAAGFIYTDEKAPPSIRGSAQALFGFIIYGLGMWIGNIASGHLKDHYTTHLIAGGLSQDVVNWTRFWTVPSLWSAVCLVLFLFLWRERPNLQQIEV
jgi:MFS family permease